MILLNFSKWDSSHGSIFTMERLYKRGKWTPLCRVSLRYHKTTIEMYK